MNRKLSIALLIAGVGMVGGILPDAASAQAEDPAYVVIEKEAHSRPHHWLQVMMSKYDGHCRTMGDYSARRFMDTIAANEVHLVSAEKVANDYVLSYKYGMAMTMEAVFTTSQSLCQKVIQEHIGQ
jgi:hypothetical protein